MREIQVLKWSDAIIHTTGLVKMKKLDIIKHWQEYRVLNNRRSGSKFRRGGGEEILLAQGKEQRLHFAGAAVKRYPTPKVRGTQVRWYVLQEGIRGQTH